MRFNLSGSPETPVYASAAGSVHRLTHRLSKAMPSPLTTQPRKITLSYCRHSDVCDCLGFCLPLLLSPSMRPLPSPSPGVGVGQEARKLQRLHLRLCIDKP